MKLSREPVKPWYSADTDWCYGCLNTKDDDAERQLNLTHGIGAAQLYLFFV